MPLFDNLIRNELGARRLNQSTFDYLNVSARPGIVACRLLLEEWFGEIPEAHANDIHGRFCSRREDSHQGAFWELYLHALLRRMGYEVSIHPNMPDCIGTHPDFLAEGVGPRSFYVEATQARPPRDDAAAQGRINEVYDTLNRMESPNFFLEMRVRGESERNIPGRRLREDLEHWLRTLNPDEIAGYFERREFEQVPALERYFEGLQISFSPIPKSRELRGQNGIRPIGLFMPRGAQFLQVNDDIRAAVEGKAQKYGELAAPLIIAINVDEDHCDLDDVVDALFGDLRVICRLGRNNELLGEEWARVRNGALLGPQGARNKAVSLVIITWGLSPTTLRTADMWVVHNPCATRPLPCDFLSLPQLTVENGHLNQGVGTHAADTLRVPRPWPVPD